MTTQNQSPPVTWRDYARLARLELVGLSLAPIVGAVAARGAELRAAQVAALYAINVPIMIAAIVHNDLMDIHFDRRSPLVADRPLASGRIPRSHAWFMVGGCLALNAATVGIFFPDPFLITLIALSWIGAALYNILSKRFAGADFFFAAGAAFPCLYGAIAVMPDENGFSGLPSMVWVLTAVTFATQFHFNAIAGGLKDLANDRLNGVGSLAVRFSRMGRDGLEITPGFKAIAVAIEVAVIFILLIPFVFLGKSNPGQAGLLILTGIMMLQAGAKLLNTPLGDREKIAKYAMRGASSANILLWILVLDVAGWRWMIFLFIAPFVWFFAANYLVHGRTTRLPRTF